MKKIPCKLKCKFHDMCCGDLTCPRYIEFYRRQLPPKPKPAKVKTRACFFKIVGSILVKSPRDFDVVMILSDKDFAKKFKMSQRRWRKEGETGQWSKERFAWSRESIRLGRIFERRIKKALSKHPLDFKIIPKSEDERITKEARK